MVLMLSILVIHTFTLSFWLSSESKVKSKKSENNTKLNFDSSEVLPAIKMDSNVRKTLNSSASLRQ